MRDVMAIYLVEIAVIDHLENRFESAIRWVKNGYVRSLDNIDNSEIPAKGWPVESYNELHGIKLKKYRFTRLYECEDELDLKK